MTTKLTRVAVIALVLALAGWTGAAAAENVWVADDGEVIKLHSAHAWSINADDAEEFDLSDLADGESRVFGEGDKQITVSRQGDEVTISHPPERDGSPMTIVCELDTDECKLLTFEEGPARTAIIVRKQADCAGDEDCDHILLTELAMAWNLAYVARFDGSRRKPVVAVGSVWRDLVAHLTGLLDTDDLVTCVDDVESAVQEIATRLG